MFITSMVPSLYTSTGISFVIGINGLVIVVGLVGIGMQVFAALKELKQINIRLAQSVEWSRYLANVLEAKLNELQHCGQSIPADSAVGPHRGR